MIYSNKILSDNRRNFDVNYTGREIGDPFIPNHIYGGHRQKRRVENTSYLIIVLYFSVNMEMSTLTRDGTAEPVSRDQILWRERGQGDIHFPCSADHDQDWQPYSVDPYS